MLNRLGVVGMLGLWASVIAGCTDPLTTLEMGENPAMEGISERVHPGIRVLGPEPGHFATESTVVLRGELTEGTAPLTTLEINGEEVPFGSTSTGAEFEIVRELVPGPNIFGFRVNAEDGGRAVEAVTVYGPGTHEPGERLEESLIVRLGQAFLDNNTVQLDDLAGILEALIKDETFLASFFSEPYVVSENTTLTVQRVSITDVAIDVVAVPGCLDTRIWLGDVGAGGWVEIDIATTGPGAILGDVVTLEARSILLEALICPDGVGGALSLEVIEPVVEFEEFLLSTNDYPDLGESFASINDLIASMAESALETWLGESMAELMLEILEGFVGSYSFGVDPVVKATFSIQTVGIDGKGLSIGVSGGFSSPAGLEGVSAAAGSMRSDDTGLAGNFSDAPLAVAMSDDLLNQLLFAFWYGGGVADFGMPTEELSALPEVFQPVTGLDVALNLPPTFVEATYREEYGFDMAVGGIAVTLTSEDQIFEIDLHIQAGVGLRISDEGELELLLDNRAQKINVQAGVSEAPDRHDKGDLAALLRFMVPPVLGQVGVSYGGFPIPSFKLSEFGESLSGFGDREVRFQPSSVTRQGEGGGYVVVEGTVQEI